MTQATLLIPAHNEAAVIGRTLWYLSRGLPLDRFRVIVIANGCDDATSARARAALPQAELLETDRAGKCHALNLGYAHASPGAPVICLDADLDVTSEAVLALLEPLQSGAALAACGQMDVDVAASAPLVRLFYKGWRRNPYFNRGKFGGLVALSPEAAARVFPLPDIIADDEYIRRSFAPGEVAFVKGCRFVARAPRTLASLIRVRRRSLRGARSVARLGMKSPEGRSSWHMLRKAITSPSDRLPIAVFLAISIWVRVSMIWPRAGSGLHWERDLTTRAEGGMS